MGKKEKASVNSNSPLLLVLLVCLAAGGSWWIWKNKVHVENMKDRLFEYIDNQDLLTLESKFTPEQIMDARKGELIGQDKRSWQEPASLYYPYLLLDVKYNEDLKSREGMLLWGLVDGEMVLNTETWETTHGFKDCLECGAERSDFKIIRALAKQQGASTAEGLQKDLQVEREVLDQWLEKAKQKHLIVQKGALVQLHFENPRLLVAPQTQFKQQLVSKPASQSQKAPKTFSRNEILAIAKTAFGDNFKVRSEQEIYLPVYRLQVLNGDGSVHTSDWNAVTGRRVR